MADVIMPKMGEDVTEGTILRWLRQDGDHINAGQPVVEIETDKANVEVVAEEAGILRILAALGQMVPVGATIATIHGSGEPVAKTVDPDTSVWPPAPSTPTPSPVPRVSWLSSNFPRLIMCLCLITNLSNYLQTRHTWSLIAVIGCSIYLASYARKYFSRG